MTHPLAALLKDVPRYTPPYTRGDWFKADDVLAALEAAPVPDLVEAGKVAERADTYEVWVDGKSCNMGRTIRSLLARIAAQEAETQKVRRFLKISRDEGREALERAEAAEAKVEAVIRIAASLFPGGYDNNSALICAAIAESKK